MDIVEQAISAISTGDAELAAYLIEKSTSPEADGASLGWPQEVTAHCVTNEERFAIEQALACFIEKNLRSSSVSAAVWALGKARRACHKELFERVLRVQIDGDPTVLFQAMIALDNLGAEIRRGNNSLCITETAMNRQLCRAYLDSVDR